VGAAFRVTLNPKPKAAFVLPRQHILAAEWFSWHVTRAQARTVSGVSGVGCTASGMKLHILGLQAGATEVGGVTAQDTVDSLKQKLFEGTVVDVEPSRQRLAGGFL
jgi:hypothetical protein